MKKMSNVDLLAELGELEDIRYYLGLNDGNDTSMDDEINAASPLTLTRWKCGFELGHESWANNIIDFYELTSGKVNFDRIPKTGVDFNNVEPTISPDELPLYNQNTENF